jgi:Fe-S cluster assembly scaffold protein SufB
MDWKQRQREQGYKDVLVWLSPEALEALREMEAETDKKRKELINEAILAFAGKESSHEASQSLEERVAALEEKVEQLLNPQDPALEAIKAKKEENKSYKQIATELNEEGIPLPKTSKSSEWTEEIVRKYYKNNKQLQEC